MVESLRVRIRKKKAEERRRVYSFLIGMAIVGLAFGFFFMTQREDVQKSYIYPYPYRAATEMYAALYGVDSSLVASVIMSESKFKNDVHSHRGAIGLMQLMPETARWVAGQLEEQDFNLEQLHDPDTNIRYGTWYLSSLKKEFAGNEVLMLAAYNAGRGNVHEWMDTYGWTMDFSAVEEIPYEETKAYVASVLKNKKKYETLYRKNGS
mgnify:CR=1 FL=1